MPRIRVNGVELHYESNGSGAEAVVLAHGLLFSGEMFRGQGRSEVTAGGYGMDNLARDAESWWRRSVQLRATSPACRWAASWR